VRAAAEEWTRRGRHYSLGASVPKTSGMKTVARARVPTRTRARTHTRNTCTRAHTRATHARAHTTTHTSNAREPRGGHTHTGAIAGRPTAAAAAVVVGDLLLVTAAASEDQLVTAASLLTMR